MDNSMNMNGKVALVTGGATGIGAAISEALAHAGATVVLTDINEAAGQTKAAELVAQNLHAKFRRQDVASETEWRETIDAVVSEHGGLDVLVNNAGILIGGLLTDISLDDFRKTYTINVEGVFLGMKYAALAMRPDGSSGRGGSIVNLSSVAGIIGTVAESVYGSSKGAVRSMTKHAAVEFSALGYGIRVNSVHPGLISTPMGDQLVDALANKVLGSKEAAQQMVQQLTPMRRNGETSEVAKVVHFLAADAASYVTGAEYIVDGGLTAM